MITSKTVVAAHSGPAVISYCVTSMYLRLGQSSPAGLWTKTTGDNAEVVDDYNLPSLVDGEAMLHDAYSQPTNAGFINIDTDADIFAFAIESIRR